MSLVRPDRYGSAGALTEDREHAFEAYAQPSRWGREPNPYVRSS